MKHIFTLSVLLICPFLLSACVGAPGDSRAAQIKLIPIEQTGKCQFVGNVFSEAPYYGIFTKIIEDKLITLAKESAVRLGAGYLVLDEPVEINHKYTLQGKAYSCPQ